jgi:hypothetical protein
VVEVNIIIVFVGIQQPIGIVLTSRKGTLPFWHVVV